MGQALHRGDALYEPFVTKFTAAIRGWRDDLLLEETVLGPLSSVAAATRLPDQVDGRRRRARP